MAGKKKTAKVPIELFDWKQDDSRPSISVPDKIEVNDYKSEPVSETVTAPGPNLTQMILEDETDINSLDSEQQKMINHILDAYNKGCKVYYIIKDYNGKEVRCLYQRVPKISKHSRTEFFIEEYISSPYTSADEMKQDYRTRGPWIRQNASRDLLSPVAITDTGIVLLKNPDENPLELMKIGYDSLCDNFIWDDGTPVGNMIKKCTRYYNVRMF